MAFFVVLVLLSAVGLTTGQRRAIVRQQPLPANKLCRGEFDCQDPEECDSGYCVKVPFFCRWPGKPSFGNIYPDRPTYNFGSQVEFNCVGDYKLVGKKRITCKEDGLWDGDKPACVATGCSHPGRPYRGLITPDKNSYELGELVQISCKSYYILQGVQQIRCREDGTWSRDLPKCNKPSRNL